MGLIVAWAVLTSFQVLTSETFRGFQDLRSATIYGGVVTWVVVAVGLALAWRVVGSLDLEQVLVLAAAATALSLALGLVALARRTRRLPRGEPISTRDVAAIAAPLWVNGLTGFALGQADLWVVGALLSKPELGVYTIVQRLVTLVSTWLILVNLVVPPFIAELYARGERARLERVLRQTASLAGLPALAVLGAYVAFGGPILGIAGPEYRAGAVALAVLSIGRMVNVVTGSCGVTMSMTGHQTQLMAINLASGVLTLGLCWLGARTWGLLGVAAASSAGMTLQNVALWLATRRSTGMWTHVGLVRWADLRTVLGVSRTR
jgi:O-antigen/teichoic acid export membrane protein